jgi:hypothetical protein
MSNNTLFIITDDVYTRDEWGRKQKTFSAGSNVYGKEDGDDIVITVLKRRIRVSKNKVKYPDLQCKGWDGPCDRNDAWREHMNTRYVNEESNYATLCSDCWKECNAHWKEMWADYYSGCM